MPMDRFQLAHYKAQRMNELTGRLRAKKLQDEDRKWLQEARTRKKGDWTKADETRALKIQREQKQFEQGQETYQHGLKRRPIVEGQQDKLTGLKIREAGRGPRPVLSTGYDPETDAYANQLIDPYTGETKPVKGGLQPVPTRRLYDITSAEVSAWKASNFDEAGVPNKDDFMPLDEYVRLMRQSLGSFPSSRMGGSSGGWVSGPSSGKKGLKRNRLAPVETPATERFRLMPGSKGEPGIPRKKKTIPGLYEPIG